jgi:hypothetical protein
MAKKEIVSIFTVTELKTGKQIEEAIIGCGQEAIRYLRKQYPKFTKFVLDGFEIDGQFFPLQLKR